MHGEFGVQFNVEIWSPKKSVELDIYFWSHQCTYILEIKEENF